MKGRGKGETTIPVSKWIPDTLFQTIQKTTPIPCVDLIVLRENKKGSLETLLIKRKIYPEEKKWCLIGGRILKDEETKQAIARQAKEELGVSVKILGPWDEETPFAVYNDHRSDAQKHFVVLTFPVIITKGTISKSGPEFSEAKWFSLDALPTPLGFHHKHALAMFKKYTRKNRLSGTSI